MNASDVMTRGVVTVRPETPLDEAIRLMLDKHVSGLPVVDADRRLVGILSEGDMLRRAELGTENLRPRWLEIFLGTGRMATDYVETHSRRVGDVMTTTVFTVAETTPLDEVVAIMERKHVKRLPVVTYDEVVGMVSRADLLRALARLFPHAPEQAVSDTALRSQVLAELRRQDWAPGGALTVTVEGGVVDLDGTILDERERSAIRVVAENVPGVRSVRDHLVWVEPNTGFTYGAP